MKQMINEYNSKEYDEIPIPIKAGILAYEFVTIHPFWDGNGRCARLLATFILKSYGYDLKGFYVLEEFYDKNIAEYYRSLQMGLHHNFYFGRNEANITDWLEYFISTMATTFEVVGNRVKEIYENSKDKIDVLDTLDKRERWVASYILTNNKIKAKDIANHFKINLDTANNWIKRWVENGFLTRYNNTQIRNIDYILTDKYRKSEIRIIYLMLNNKEVIRNYEKNLGFLVNDDMKKLANEIVYFKQINGGWDYADFITYVMNKPWLKETLDIVLNTEQMEEYTKEELDDYFTTIKKHEVEKQINRLTNKMKETLDIEEKIKIAKRIENIKKEVLEW